MEAKKIYMGLDLGTESCGWAVTDENYNIIKKSGKHLHGVRKFSAAEPAQERRLKRSARRRLDRRKERLDILQSFFAEEVATVDDKFFLRLNESFFMMEDKVSGLGKYSLFNDKLFTDKQYYKKFKTIFHLRDYLQKSDKKEDIRLIYLACHNILKYRGNFLMENISLDTNTSSNNSDYSEIIKMFNEINDFLNNSLGYDESIYSLDINENNLDEILKIINDSSSMNDRIRLVNKLVNKSNNKDNKRILELVLGKKIKLKDLLHDKSYEELEHNYIKFSEEKYESEVEPILTDMLGHPAEAVHHAKKIYNWILVKNILKDASSISDAKVREYNQHHEDLITLKAFVRKHFNKEKYDEVFRLSDKKIHNYPAYVRTNLINNKKEYVKGCSYEDFIKYLKSIIGDFESKYSIKLKENKYSNNLSEADYLTYQKIKDKVETFTFLPKQRITTNGVIPYQLHMSELKNILENASKHYDFLNVEDDNLTIKDKVLELMKFRIPYYIGPLNPAHKGEDKADFAWVNRKERGKVLPWNFDKLIDKDKSAEEFITRMTKKCTYIKNEDVLPKQSILYSEFMVLNELNNLQINGNPIDIDLKTNIIDHLYKKNKKVTLRKIKKYLLANGYFSSDDPIIFAGVDDELKNTMSSYISLNNIFPGFESNFNQYEMVERIIFLLTLFEDNKMAIERIKKEYNNLDKKTLDQIKRLTFTGWGSLSRAFLEEKLRVVDDNGQPITIMYLLRKENLNLQKALYDTRYNLIKKLDDINSHQLSQKDLTYESIMEDVYLSPGIKRSLWQALKIVDEVKKIIGRPIDKFFVEVARGGGIKGKRSYSRRNQLENLYSKAKEQADLVDLMKKELSKIEDDNKLRGDKLYLYFLQLGRCMYTGKAIDLDKLASNAYDIDHIIPRSYLKDDSLNNRVLVEASANKVKSDTYPYLDIIPKMLGFWKKLKDNNLINDEKYKRLTRKEPLSDREKGDFVNRQLVYTNQAVKALNEILIKSNPKSDVVYSKAGNVSDFRHDFSIIKSREINDFHHAHDAYLNIVVGNTYHTKFGKNAIIFFQKEKDKDSFRSTKKLFFRDTKGAWDKKESIKIVEKMLSLKDVLVTKMVVERKGGFYDETLYPKTDKNAQDLYPLKTSDKRYENTEQYGGFKSLNIAYFMVINHKKGKKRIETIEGMPVVFVEKLKRKEISINDVLENYLNLEDPKVIVDKLKVGTLLKIEDTYANLGGKAGQKIIVHNANQLFLNKEYTKYFHLIEKHERGIEKIKDLEKYNEPEYIISKSSNKNIPDQKLTKYMNLKIYDELIAKFDIDLYKGITIGGFYQDFVDARDNFIKINVRQQAHSLHEMVKMMHCNATIANLSLFMKSASNKGSNTIGKNISNKKIVIYDESVTGLYRKVRWQKK